MDWKGMRRKLLFPPPWLILLLSIFSTGALIAVFVTGGENSYLAYFVYALSFYTLSALTAWVVKTAPQWRRTVKEKITGHPYASRYMTDASFKTKVSLGLSLTASLVYAGINVVWLILNHSAWFGILATYYSTLAIMRFLLLRHVHKAGIGTDPIGEGKRSGLCAVILLTLNLTLSGAILMILYQDRGYEYHGILIYAMAAYTFYITTHAIVNLIKARKYESPVITTARGINLSAALVSMLALETAMLSEFGKDVSTETRWIFLAATGAAVEIAVLLLSLFLLWKARKQILSLKSRS